MGVQSFTLSCTLGSVLTHTFASPCFGHEPKVKVAIFFTPTSSNTTSILTTLHLESNGYFLLFLENFELNQNLELFFRLGFTIEYLALYPHTRCQIWDANEEESDVGEVLSGNGAWKMFSSMEMEMIHEHIITNFLAT